MVYRFYHYINQLSINRCNKGTVFWFSHLVVDVTMISWAYTMEIKNKNYIENMPFSDLKIINYLDNLSFIKMKLTYGWYTHCLFLTFCEVSIHRTGFSLPHSCSGPLSPPPPVSSFWKIIAYIYLNINNNAIKKPNYISEFLVCLFIIQ